MTNTNTVSSPFRYRTGCIFTCDNDRISISYKDINSLLSKGIIQPIDFELLRAIYKFKYINRYNLEIYINRNIEINPTIKQEKYKKRLSTLVEYGIVLRHYASWENGSIIERTPYIYTLSRGGLAFINKKDRLKIKNIDEYLIIEAPELLLNRLAFNQCVIQYLSSLQTIEFHSLNVHAYSQKFKTNYMLYGIFNISYQDQSIPFIVEPIRKTIQWKSHLISRITLLFDYYETTLKKKGSYIPPVIIFVCEDDMHIKETHKCIMEHDLGDLPILYTTDIRLVNQSLSNSFIICREVDNDNFELVRHSLSIG